MNPKVNDWVMFVKNGVPTLGVVQYITEDVHYPHKTQYWTTTGMTHKEFILEIREAK